MLIFFNLMYYAYMLYLGICNKHVETAISRVFDLLDISRKHSPVWNSQNAFQEFSGKINPMIAYA